MKKIPVLFVMIALVMVAVFPATGNVSAQKFSAYTTGTQIMNLADTTATVSLTYYSMDDGSSNAGKIVDSTSTTIAGNSSSTFFPTLTGFQGSMVVASDLPTAAVTNIQNATKTAGASYVGASAGANTIELPLLMKNNGSVPYDTWFSVQNAGGTTANISIIYSDYSTPVTATILSNSSKTFYQSKETFHTKTVFSAEITSDQPLVVVVVEENTAKILAYTGFGADTGSLSTRLVMPLVNSNNNNITTGIQIQNTSNTDTTVTVEYTPSLSGTACTETQMIPAKSSATFALVAFSAYNTRVTTTCKAGEKFIGSAQVTDANNSGHALLVGIVNQTKPIYGEAYGAFNPAKATAKVVLPLIMDRNGSNQWSTGFAVMNVGSATTNVKCTFTGSSFTVQGQLTSGAALTTQQYGKFSAGYVGSSICQAYTDSNYTTVDKTAQIVAVVNETGVQTSDHLLVYEGINVAVP